MNILVIGAHPDDCEFFAAVFANYENTLSYAYFYFFVVFYIFQCKL